MFLMSALPAHRMDALKSISGAANNRAFRGSQKRYGRALGGLTDSTTSRHFAGHHAPSTKFLALVAMADRATAYPYIAEAISIVNQNQIRRLSVNGLYARLGVLNEREHTANAESDRTTLSAAQNPTIERLHDAANADVVAAEIALERAAVLRELAERKRQGERI